jgi:DNA damage-inducible protein 1
VTQTQTPAPAPGASTESKIAKLVELGFDREKCAEALEASGGNEEYAASLLFSGF